MGRVPAPILEILPSASSKIDVHYDLPAIRNRKMKPNDPIKYYGSVTQQFDRIIVN